MESGDIVTKGLQAYVVVQVPGDGFAHLISRSKELVTIREDDDSFEVLANPYRQWPYIILPHRFHKLGELTSAGRPSVVTGNVAPFKAYEEWLLGEPTRSGGSLYFNPSLGLRYLDRVSLTFSKGSASVIVPKRFLPVAHKAAAARFSKVRSSPPTVYDRLMEDEED